MSDYEARLRLFDDLLINCARSAERDEFYRVRLLVGGSVIEGVTVSTSEYLLNLSSMHKEGGGNLNLAKSAFYNQKAEIHAKEIKENDRMKPPYNEPHELLFLKDVSINSVRHDGYFIVKISSIDGASISLITSSQGVFL